MFDLPYSRCAGSKVPVKSLLIFLFHLAWKSRIRLPVLIAVGLMVLDIRMQLEINIDWGRGGRQGAQVLGQGNEPPAIDLDDFDSDETLGEDSYTSSTYTAHSDSTIESTDDENDDNTEDAETG